ncbi:hypothetical protein B0H19DRAFT_1106615 [Mycena capillaripes]|nr:hypothetical protein B0H19DRAFT_1106615 [Mycena capillaripes]
MDVDQLAELRSKYNRLLTPQTAPPIVMFMGKKQPSPTLKSSPSTSGSLQYMDTEDMQSDADEEFDEKPWALEWDADFGPWPCSWGWHVRANNEKSFYLFLSGGYVVWLQKFASSLKVNSLIRLQTHMKVTMFHELTHISETLVHGRQQTPEKNCHAPQRVVNGMGESGRHAELLAFGGVLDMLVGNCRRYSNTGMKLTKGDNPAGNTVTLFTSNLNITPTEDYTIDDDTLAALFSSSELPLHVQNMATSPQHRFIGVPEFARSKEGGTLRSEAGGCEGAEGTQVYEEIGAPRPSPRPASWPQPFGMTVITGKLAETIEQSRVHITWLKGGCIQVE